MEITIKIEPKLSENVLDANVYFPVYIGPSGFQPGTKISDFSACFFYKHMDFGGEAQKCLTFHPTLPITYRLKMSNVAI